MQQSGRCNGFEHSKQILNKHGNIESHSSFVKHMPGYLATLYRFHTLSGLNVSKIIVQVKPRNEAEWYTHTHTHTSTHEHTNLHTPAHENMHTHTQNSVNSTDVCVTYSYICCTFSPVELNPHFQWICYVQGTLLEHIQCWILHLAQRSWKMCWIMIHKDRSFWRSMFSTCEYTIIMHTSYVL